MENETDPDKITVKVNANLTNHHRGSDQKTTGSHKDSKVGDSKVGDSKVGHQNSAVLSQSS